MDLDLFGSSRARRSFGRAWWDCQWMSGITWWASLRFLFDSRTCWHRLLPLVLCFLLLVSWFLSAQYRRASQHARNMRSARATSITGAVQFSEPSRPANDTSASFWKVLVMLHGLILSTTFGEQLSSHDWTNDSNSYWAAHCSPVANHQEIHNLWGGNDRKSRYICTGRRKRANIGRTMLRASCSAHARNSERNTSDAPVWSWSSSPTHWSWGLWTLHHSNNRDHSAHAQTRATTEWA